MLNIVLIAAGLLVLTALSAALAARSNRAVQIIGVAGIGAMAIGAIAAGSAVWRPGEEELQIAWSLPVGACHVGLDALSAFFLLCIFLVSGLAAVYGVGYMRAYAGKRKLAPAIAFYHLLVASMAVVAVARDAVLFLLAWEVMSLSSFFLVTYENDKAEAREAGLTYFVASHIGVAFLIAFFALLGNGVASFDFKAMAGLPSGAPAARLADICFLLAVIGFGTKAGFWPLHIWLPDAHPAAPSHVSAVMSGVMIKMGIYGLLRSMTFLGSPHGWWGALIVVIGIISGIVGVLQALTQHDLKRLLAYCSVENIGIIALGVGVGMIGQNQSNDLVAFLGYSGALLHVLNHGLFKGLLFQCAGSVLHGTGTRNIESLGALQKRMPVTALTFLTGSVAICGLPPLNGFVSEWLIFMGAFRGAAVGTSGVWAAASILVILALSLIGGLALACFVKAYGVVFLGEPRTEQSANARESGPVMLIPMVIGAGVCAVLGLWPDAALRLVAPAAAILAGIDSVPMAATGPLSAVTRAAFVLVGLIALLILLRSLVLKGRPIKAAATWGCGYAVPGSPPLARAQYTAASFAQPLLSPFAAVLPKKIHENAPAGYFPSHARYEEHAGDAAKDWLIFPAFRGVRGLLGRMLVIQRGRIQLYLGYVLMTLIALLIWQLSGGGK